MAFDSEFLLPSRFSDMYTLREHGVEIPPLHTWWYNTYSLGRAFLPVQTPGKPAIPHWERRGREGRLRHSPACTVQWNESFVDSGSTEKHRSFTF